VQERARLLAYALVGVGIVGCVHQRLSLVRERSEGCLWVLARRTLDRLLRVRDLLLRVCCSRALPRQRPEEVVPDARHDREQHRDGQQATEDASWTTAPGDDGTRLDL